VTVPKSPAHMVRDKLEFGTLPRDDPATLLARIGSGRACSVCGHPIVASQTELEPQYDDDRPMLIFHIVCHDLWDAERRVRHYRAYD
jgi:hypothetical protein